MDSVLVSIKEIVAAYGLNVIAALVIFFVGRLAVGWAVKVLEKIMARAATDATLISFTSNIVRVAGVAFVALAALAKLGVETTSFIAVLGAAGLAVGLALQGSLSNFAAGVMMILFRPFKVGDYVEAGGTAGTVEEVMIFNTKMRTGDNREIWVPNGKIINATIVNYSARDTRRVDMVFGCAYDDDVRRVKSVLEEILACDDRILEAPAPLVALSELADSGINFVVRPWVNAGDYWAVKYDVTEAVKLRFDAEGISIPFPQRDVHLHQAA